jgi:4,5-dihydroxyphthalate decarboxylase
VSIKREILEAHPWVAATLLKAFTEAKALAIDDLMQTSALPLSLPFLTEHAYDTIAIMGQDFWPYGLEANRHTLETFVRYMYEQGLIEQKIPVDDLFAPSTHRMFRI